MMVCCDKCGSDQRVVVYNDFNGSRGDAICDRCNEPTDAGSAGYVVMIDRPEGYYHAPIGTFD